jgi:predicted dehydrogenase
MTSVAPCPEHVAIIGGGRWARVLTEVLCGLIPASVEISVHSEHNAEAMSTWAAARGLSNRLRISASWPAPVQSSSRAVIVANATRDHERAAEWALAAGVPVLVEKPMAMSGAGAQRLAALARSLGTRLAAAHVLRFAGYLDRFATCVGKAGPICSMRIQWWDPRVEERYGEPKHFDAGVPVVADVLPHVLSLVTTLMPNVPCRCDHLKVLRGGAHVELDLVVGQVRCGVQLVRNSEQRRRLIEVAVGVGRTELLQLDFSTEPGIITWREEALVGDLEWGERPRPVAQMLTAFLQWAAGGDADARLDVELGVRACAMIDQAVEAYRAALVPWISARLDSRSRVDEDLRYALNEILQAEPAPASPADLAQGTQVTR